MPYEGLQLAGRYNLLRILGSGGMGEVYLAEDTRIQRQVAVKVVRGELSPYPNSENARKAAQLFEREMKTISKLDHPHILPLYDYGEEEERGSALTYMVMPYRPEGSLAQWLREQHGGLVLSSADVAFFIAQAADALQHANNHQIIHQDVKPSNFLIRSRPEQPQHPDLLLTDFGIARFTSGTSSTSQTIRGTPTYMAPEQWEGQPTYATDQYALAIMTHELLVGRPPFEGGPGQMMYKHLMSQPEPPSRQNPNVPKDVDTVILHALAKKPQERFGSVSAFANALQQSLDIDALPTVMSSHMPAVQGQVYPPYASDVQASLTISAQEAKNGTSRTLTINGREVHVTIPPGAYAGQVIRIENWAPNTPGSLLLNLAIEVPDLPTVSSGGTPRSLPRTEMAPTGPTVISQDNLETIRSSSPNLVSPSTPARTTGEVEPTRLAQTEMAPTRQSPTILPPPPGQYGSGSSGQHPSLADQTPYAPSLPRRSHTGRNIFLILLILLLILGSGGLFVYFANGNHIGGLSSADQTTTVQTNDANNTASANRGTQSANGTSTAQTDQANANGTSTAQANGTATGVAQGNIDATNTAVAQNNQAAANAATATAVAANATANANATATAQAIPNLSVRPPTVTATRGSNTTDCTYSTSGLPAWYCTVTLTNSGTTDANWQVSSGNTLGGVTPSSGTVPGKGNSQLQLSISDDSTTPVTCPGGTITFTFSDPNSPPAYQPVSLLWQCQG